MCRLLILMSKDKMKILFVLACILAQPAYAYIDPGTGSALIQGLIAAIAAIGVTLKLYWHRLRVAIGFSKRSEEGDRQQEGSADPE